MIRTFHPVGQGAFYTEVHKHNGQTFTIVYDCGSGIYNWTPHVVKNEIINSFKKNHVIDVLFISHFHADHINGIEFLKSYCKIKSVVIPVLSSQAIVLTKIYNLIEKNYFETEIFDNPISFFGKETTIIRIEEGNNDENPINITTDNQIVLPTPIQGQIYPSGTIFNSNINNDWYFIPYNYKQTEIVHDFENYLQNELKLPIDNIRTIEDIIKHKAELRKAFEALGKNLNQHSMILYSGKNQTDLLKKKTWNCCSSNSHQNQLPCLKLKRMLQNTESGCLYLGDIDLNQGNIVNNIKQHYSNFLSFIGTLQVPHHGSAQSYNSNIITSNMHCAIVSYGENNYGHPCEAVVYDLFLNDIFIYRVTNLSCSRLIQNN